MTECEGQGDRPEQCGAQKIRGDQDPPPAEPIDPNACEQPERWPGKRSGAIEETNLCRRGTQNEDGHGWQRQHGDPVAGDADSASRPEEAKVAVPQRTPARTVLAIRFHLAFGFHRTQRIMITE